MRALRRHVPGVSPYGEGAGCVSELPCRVAIITFRGVTLNRDLANAFFQDLPLPSHKQPSVLDFL